MGLLQKYFRWPFYEMCILENDSLKKKWRNKKVQKLFCIETILILSNTMVKLDDILLMKYLILLTWSFIFLMHHWHLELSLW